MNRSSKSTSSLHIASQTVSAKSACSRTPAYIKIKDSTSTWPEWRITTHNENFAISANSEKIIRK